MTRRRQRGSIRAHGNGFQIKVYAGLDPLTKKRRYLVAQADTEPDAEIVRTRLLNQVDEKRHPKSDATVGEILDKWLEINRVEDSSRERSEIAIRMYLGPAFGAVKGQRLEAEAVELFYARLRVCRAMCGGRRDGRTDPATGAVHVCRPLSDGYIRRLHYILRPALDRAVRWGYLTSNPLRSVDAPPDDLPEPDLPSTADLARLLNAAWQRDLDWGTLLVLVAVTGCRRGELCGVRWRDVDLDAKVITLRKATGRQGELKKTKSRRLRRIAFDDITAEILAAHRDRALTRCRRLSAELAPDAFVFSLEADGSAPLKKNSVTQRYRRLATSLGMASIRLHDLRDYSATELIAAGVDPRTVAGRLGHANPGTTLRVYSAWVAEADRRAATEISGRLPRPGHGMEPAEAVLSPWERMTADLRTAIEDGTMQAGETFPTVADLAATHEVSVGTAHRVFAQLKREGLLAVSRGRRAVVIGPSPSEPAVPR